MTQEPATFDAKAFAPEPPAPHSGGYVYPPGLVLAVRVALATSRPLLLRGAPGCGKTTLARDVARRVGADYYPEVVTSRTEARDLEWRFDAVLRLAEAHVESKRARVADATNYVEPRALWWGFDPASARRRGGAGEVEAADPLAASGGSKAARAVVLIDEIDKAEPEVANDLLEPLDQGGFTVAEIGVPVSRARPVFLVVTTNEERDLPAAFLRRCVVFELERPERKVLLDIELAHFGATTDGLADKMIDRLDELAAEARERRVREPGTAEFIDALRACRRLGVSPGGKTWEAITRLSMWKHPSKKEERA